LWSCAALPGLPGPESSFSGTAAGSVHASIAVAGLSLGARRGMIADSLDRSRPAPPAAPLITPLQLDSPQSLSQAAEAPTGAPDRFACSSPAPPVAHSSSSASEHPSARPRELASPAPPAHGDGGCQHAPALPESAKALTESAGALRASVPLPMQHEDRGHQAAASLTPVPGS
jgi:hypothetical protein